MIFLYWNIINIINNIIMINPYSAGIEFSRQKLTSVDVRFWPLNSILTL